VDKGSDLMAKKRNPGIVESIVAGIAAGASFGVAYPSGSYEGEKIRDAIFGRQTQRNPHPRMIYHKGNRCGYCKNPIKGGAETGYCSGCGNLVMKV
jgi:hypothetical protein